MRKAIYEELIEIENLEGVYQPYSAPENCATPYAVVKMYGDEEVPENFKGQKDSFSVFIYNSPDSFISLDSLVWEVREALDNIVLEADDGTTFIPEYIKTVEDAHDDVKNLFFKRLDFNIPGIRI